MVDVLDRDEAAGRYLFCGVVQWSCTNTLHSAGMDVVLVAAHPRTGLIPGLLHLSDPGSQSGSIRVCLGAYFCGCTGTRGLSHVDKPCGQPKESQIT